MARGLRAFLGVLCDTCSSSVRADFRGSRSPTMTGV